MIKALKTLAVGLPIAAAAMVAVPGTANASLSECSTTGWFCGWINDNFSGTMGHWSGNSANWGAFSDNVESVKNNAASSETVPDNVVLYRDINYGGRDLCVNPGETYDTSILFSDNTYSSSEWVHSC
jgi:peptidase inhibitor family I36